MPYGQVLVDTVKDSLNNVLAPASAVFRNRIINGAMVIDQRNAGASVATSSGTSVYTVDRWAAIYSQTSKFTIQQLTTTPPTGYTNYLGITSSSAYTVGASEQFNIFQAIEGYNIADLGWGTANAKTVTLSFWVQSSLTGIFGGVLSNNGKARTYPFTYTISSANTWTPISLTIAGDTSGTWNTTNSVGMYVVFGLGVGATVSATAGSWNGAGSIFGATGATSVVGTNGATFYITGVQLEVGTNASNFDYRPYGTELALCQRYYEMYPSMAYRNSNGTIISAGTLFGYMVNTLVGFSGGTGTQASISSSFKVEKRATPTVTVSTRSTAYTNQVETRGGNTVYSFLDKTTSGVTVIANQTTGGSDCYIGYGYEASAEL